MFEDFGEDFDVDKLPVFRGIIDDGPVEMKTITAEWNGQPVTLEIPAFIYEGAVRASKRPDETLEGNLGLIVQAMMDAAYEVDGEHFPCE